MPSWGSLNLDAAGVCNNSPSLIHSAGIIMKLGSLIPLSLVSAISASLAADTAPSQIIPSAPQPAAVQEKVAQEVTLINTEPLMVNVINFPSEKIQRVQLDANSSINVNLNKNDTINVAVSNPVRILEKEKPNILLLNESTNVLTSESAVLVGELSTDLQGIFIYKAAVKNKYGEQMGLKLHLIADDKIEVSKDIKVLVQNTVYLDEEEVKKLQSALSKMLSTANNPVENKDFKLSFKTTGDFELNVYTTKKIFSASRNVEASITIGKNEKYSSKAIMSLKELVEFQTILNKYGSTPVSPL
jgi:hypothetical protein